MTLTKLFWFVKMTVILFAVMICALMTLVCVLRRSVEIHFMMKLIPYLM